MKISRGSFLQQLPSGNSQVDIVADTYQEVSLKSAERNARGISSKVMIPSNKSKVPQNFSDFLRNGGNKRRLIIFNAGNYDHFKQGKGFGLATLPGDLLLDL